MAWGCKGWRSAIPPGLFAGATATGDEPVFLGPERASATHSGNAETVARGLPANSHGTCQRSTSHFYLAAM